MSALRSNLSRLNQPVQSFDHSVYKAFLKSLSHRKPTTIIPKGVLSVPQIHTFFQVNSTLPQSSPYALAFSLGLFAYIRISNLVPASDGTFDSNKQLVYI